MILKRCLLFVLTTLAIVSCSANSAEHLRLAEQYASEKRFDEAIAQYRLHMASVADSELNESWRNPSFYRLAIGDILLKQGHVAKALEEYFLAEKEGIEEDSISYRIREVARWHQQRGELDAAFELLSKHRDRDPLLFNDLLDEIAREKTAKHLSPDS